MCHGKFFHHIQQRLRLIRLALIQIKHGDVIEDNHLIGAACAGALLQHRSRFV